MPARIDPKARVTPGSKVQVMEVAREFFSPLPATGKLTVTEVRLCKDGWFLVFEEHPGEQYLEPAFDVIELAELGYEREIPGLEAEVERIAAQFTIPPGFENCNFGLPDDRFSSG